MVKDGNGKYLWWEKGEVLRVVGKRWKGYGWENGEREREG